MQDPRYQLDDIVPLYQLAEETPLSRNQLRHLAANRHTNGAATAGAILVVGRNLYAHRNRFSQWLLDHQGRTDGQGGSAA